MKKYNIGILGTGDIASTGYAPALFQTKNAQLWNVLSRNEEAAKQFAKKFEAKSSNPAHTSLESLLSDPELDAVIIATPDKIHAQQALTVAQYNKHILIEKPFATDSESCRQILTACQDANVKLALCYRLHWHLGHRAVVNAVREGQFGTIKHVRTLWTSQQLDASNWRASPEVGRWWSLAAMGTHLIDLIRWVLLPLEGEIIESRATISNNVWGAHDETATATFKFEGGATADLCTSVLFNAPSRLEIYGTKGWVICEDTFGRDAGGKIWTDKGPFGFDPANPFVGLLEDFVQAIDQKREPEVNGVEGARNVEILLKLTEFP